MTSSHCDQLLALNATGSARTSYCSRTLSASTRQLSNFRLAMMTFAPRAAKACTISAPMPRLPPGTSTTLSVSSSIETPGQAFESGGSAEHTGLAQPGAAQVRSAVETADDLARREQAWYR